MPTAPARMSAAEHAEINAEMIALMAKDVRAALAPIATIHPNVTDEELANVMETLHEGLENLGDDGEDDEA